MNSSVNNVLPVNPTIAGRLSPIQITDYRLADGFWGRQQEVNRDVIIPHCDHSLEQVGWIENFRAAIRGTLATDRVGRLFTDSEIYKTMEAMAWDNAREPSEQFSARLDEFGELLAKAQQGDGYLNTFYGYEGGPERYSDMDLGHELYCYGHLIQAAVAVMRGGGPRQFIDVARRVADHICSEFGEDGRQTLGGHPEIETALVELYRATGEQRYLQQAKIFVDRRGHQTLGDTMFKGRDYYQDGVPVRDAKVLVGHAVRALYLAAGAIDVAVETGDTELFDSVKAQYDRTLARRTYLTGGMGSNHHGETFGEDFELPSDRAYAETCAAIASVHVAWRLLLATGESRYADLIERTLYNSVVSSPSEDGRAFFYVNALQRRSPGIEPEPGTASLRRTDGRRASWFTTSCCPTNLARTVSSLSGYLATVDDDGVQIHQYAAGEIHVPFGQGRRAAISVITEYPAAGEIRVRVDETDEDPWALTLRVPSWASAAQLREGDSVREVPTGPVRVERVWHVGDEIVLTLDMKPRFVYPDPRIDDLRGCVAVERGPLVYAIESVDQPDVDLDLIAIDDRKTLWDSDVRVEIDDVIPVAATGISRHLRVEGLPYLNTPAATDDSTLELTLIPYFRWANRAVSTMRVWAPRVDVLAAEESS
jgi:DUF1680 family protein